jgi:two-component system, chemotaxis family, sensor kinase CheA
MTLDLTQFHGVFFEESFEALNSMETALLQLNLGHADPELINTIFRVAHSIKGGSATFAFNEITSFTHSLETLLDELRGNRLKVTKAICTVLLQSVDLLREMLRTVQTKKSHDAQKVADLQFELELLIAKRDQQDTSTPVDVSGRSSCQWRIHLKPYSHFFKQGNDPLRIINELSQLGELQLEIDSSALPPLAELDPQNCYLGWVIKLNSNAPEASIRQLFDWAQGDCEVEIVAAMPSADPPATEIIPVAEKVNNVNPLAETGSIRVTVEKIDELMNYVGELVITQSMLDELGRHLKDSLPESVRTGFEQLARNVREVHESVMRVRMLPISFVFNRFPRMVRDLSLKLDKEVELIMTGEQTELDKTVLEKIGDPLVHLVRNSIDHGLEKPAARVAAGKSATGKIQLNAVHRGGNIAVEVIDDGAGLNTSRILAKAKDRGLVSTQDDLSANQIYELIFAPGFSTAEQTTDVSGRGVGLDVVRRNIKELGGSIELHSEPGKGTMFTITLPLTLAIIDGQSLAVGRENYIVPLNNIVESLQLSRGALNRVAGQGEVFSFRGDYVPVVRLDEVFGINRLKAEHEGIVVVIEGEGRRVGLLVDDLLGQQQVVIKSLDTNFGRVSGISGATILGDGSVALILDLPGIIRNATTRMHA